ncbi:MULTISPECIES: SPOR domain-containing protein [Burkholderia]|uniref:SPOR domain-containing protein n=1 Tax=Burkholderia TaxID=32008 RepID=UPI000841B524|nr:MULTISPECIES: SPOR domain-containing protein [unclassified Burkholderia]AOK31499.1 sporulation protein [Burkholderia sp. Bp7605]
MGIFSFGKKDDDAPQRRGSRTGSRSVRSERVERVERRARRTERPDTDALMLDPTLPEKQRARRRLVGAIALVIAAVVVLPMVLDSHPKPVTDDVAIDIPNRPSHQAAAANDEDASDAQSGVAQDEPAASETVAPADAAPAPAAPAKAKSAKSVAKQADAAVNAPAATPKSAEPAARASADANGESKPSAPASGARFAVQLGTFHDDTAARDWATKLKAAGVPAYVEHRKQADGSTATLLRAGPFADRAAASAAIAKVRDAGLTQ